MRWFLIAITLFALPLLAQNTSALINQELDKPYALNVTERTPLQEVLKRITKDTGVPITVARDAWDLLPYGDQTTISAKIENQTLRGGLTAIARTLGLTVEIKPETVELAPLPALSRLGRRATVDELRVLDLLARTPLELQGDRASVKQVLAKVDSKLESEKSQFAVEDRSPETVGNIQVAVARNQTLLDGLETIPQFTDATWYPWGRTLVVRLKVDHIRDQLGKTITRRFNGVDVSQVLAELASIADVPFIIEPGAVARLNPDSRNIRLMLDNAPIAQALENLAGFTGLAWAVTEKGVYISNPGTSAGASREPSVGWIQLDNGMQVILRESQVPPDLREYLKHKTDQQLQKIRQMMVEEGFKPTSQPATKPVGNQDL